MPANEWAVRIVTDDQGHTAFLPRVPGGTSGSELLAEAGDVVTWGNATTEIHQPWPTDASFVPVPAATPPSATPGYMSDPIPANGSSQPQFITAGAVGTVLHYCCLLHQSERGTIKIF